MPLSKKRNRTRMRRFRAQQALLGGGTFRRRLGDLSRQLEARSARVEWQSGGIRMLHERVATLEALLATQPAMADTEVMRRLAAVEVDQALHEAEHSSEGLPEWR